MSSLPHSVVTPEEYLEAERKAALRSEYADGQVFAMSGASRKHNRIAFNIAHVLGEQFRGGSCQVFGLDLKVRVKPRGPYYYPDLAVVCGEPQFQDVSEDVLLNPKVIIEILSPSTESYDRGGKFQEYRQLESLGEYLLVAQDHVQVDHFVRKPDGHWDFSSTGTLDAVVELPTIGARLKASDIYDRVKFEA